MVRLQEAGLILARYSFPQYFDPSRQLEVLNPFEETIGARMQPESPESSHFCLLDIVSILESQSS